MLTYTYSILVNSRDVAVTRLHDVYMLLQLISLCIVYYNIKLYYRLPLHYNMHRPKATNPKAFQYSRTLSVQVNNNNNNNIISTSNEFRDKRLLLLLLLLLRRGKDNNIWLSSDVVRSNILRYYEIYVLKSILLSMIKIP